jgi:deoxycytidine triphosphate deaminase
MFINPTVAIDNGWIKGDFGYDNVQPNAIDFTLNKLFTINQSQAFRIDSDEKRMRGGSEVKATFDPRFNKEYWTLHAGNCYDGMSDFYVDIPEGVAAMLIVRSTFNRNGIFITSGLYDSGYKGHCGFAIHNNSGIAHIEPNTRIGQIIFVESGTAKLYNGSWNHKDGSHYSEK